MKIGRYDAGSRGPRACVISEGLAFDAGKDPLSPVRGDELGPVEGLRLLPPVAAPGKIVCVGLNYRDHAEETGMALPESPVLFSKFGNTVVGPGDSVEIPPFAKEVDYEAELAVVIGKRTTRVGVREALDSVFGYTCLNDVSARDVQFADVQWVRGKSLDTFCPIGPWIVTADEVGDPQRLGIRCVVNDRVLQDSSTAEMVRSVSELISFISDSIRLEPGDVIATGTPAGVGFTRTPPIYLRAGDVVRVEIDGIGTLENPVIDRV